VTKRTGSSKTIETPVDFPDLADLASGKYEVQEPLIKATIVVPEEFVGNVMELCSVRTLLLQRKGIVLLMRFGKTCSLPEPARYRSGLGVPYDSLCGCTGLDGYEFVGQSDVYPAARLATD
jgi:hypothetical protein